MILFVEGNLKLYAKDMGAGKGEFWGTFMQQATLNILLHQHGFKIFSERKLTTTCLITGIGIQIFHNICIVWGKITIVAHFF